MKKYKFTYLFGFPALHSEPAWHTIANARTISASEDLKCDASSPKNSLSALESEALVESVQTWRYRVDARQYGFFLAKRIRDSLKDTRDDGSDPNLQSRATTPETSRHSPDFSWDVGSLAQFETGFFEGADTADQYVCFADPSTYGEYPGWMLRNLLILIRKRWGLTKVQVLCYRDIQTRREDARSLILNLIMNEAAESSKVDGDISLLEQAMPKVSGWERSDKGKISSKIANLGEYMDPARYDRCASSCFRFKVANACQARGPSR